MQRVSPLNSLAFDPGLCSGCGTCVEVCPQGVFILQDQAAVVTRPDDCIECGACELNCPSAAITVDSGVGCASAMIWGALSRRKVPGASLVVPCCTTSTLDGSAECT